MGTAVTEPVHLDRVRGDHKHRDLDRANLFDVVGDILQPTHLLFVLIVAPLVLGPKRLPEVGRALGSGLHDFRAAISGEDPDRHGETISELRAEKSTQPVDKPADPLG